MSIRVMSEVWKTKLPLSEKMVLLVIADHASDDGDNAWPSQKTIGDKASLSVRSVQRCVNNLVRNGYLKMEKRAGGSATCRDDRRPHRYTINLIRLRGDNLTGRQEKTDEATIATDTGRQLRPMNHSIESSRITQSFAEFWKVYPKRVGKIAAEKAFIKAVQGGIEPQTIIDGAKAYAGDKERSEAFTAHPATWLNAGRWGDERKPDLSEERRKQELSDYENWKKEIVEQQAKAVPMPDYLKDLIKRI